MARYQIRTSVDEYLEDLITEMADSGWKTLEGWDLLIDQTPREPNYKRFRSGIRNVLAGYVRTYKLCGLSNICLERLTSTHWAPEEHALDANPTDRVYHLFPSIDLDQFLVELTQRSLEPIQYSLNPVTKNSAYAMMRSLFQAVLGRFLYCNPTCGKTELCVCSSSAPVSIWQKKNRRGEPVEGLEE